VEFGGIIYIVFACLKYFLMHLLFLSRCSRTSSCQSQGSYGTGTCGSR